LEKLTEDLVGLAKSKGQAILLHELPVLFRPFASHFDEGQSVVGGSQEKYCG
jgi:hypothetical protein